MASRSVNASTVVHQAIACPQRPERCRSDLRRRQRELRRRLHRYPIARADVVEQEIAVGMDDLVAECLRIL